MKFDPRIHHRRSIRLQGYDYSQAGAYYVTIITLRRECLFGEIVDAEMRLNPLGRIVDECWRAIPDHFPNADVDVFIIMPNHVHGIVFIHDPVGATHASPLHASPLHASPLRASPLRVPPLRPRGALPGSLGAIIGSFKSAVTRRAGIELDAANIWQRNYYEHIIRSNEEYERIAGYILANPANWEKDNENPKNIPARGLP